MCMFCIVFVFVVLLLYVLCDVWNIFFSLCYIVWMLLSVLLFLFIVFFDFEGCGFFCGMYVFCISFSCWICWIWRYLWCSVGYFVCVFWNKRFFSWVIFINYFCWFVFGRVWIKIYFIICGILCEGYWDWCFCW